MSLPYTVERMNLLTRKRQDRNTLLRLAIVEGKLIFDPNNTQKGRGVYLSKNKEEILKVFQKGMLRRYSQSSDLDSLLKEVLAYVDSGTNQ